LAHLYYEEVSALCIPLYQRSWKLPLKKFSFTGNRLTQIFIHMDEYSTELDHTFSALAHPKRRKMLDLLAGGEMRVTDLAARFPGALNVASRHIMSLERAGLVKRRREGRVHHLQMDAAPLAEAAAFIERYRARWERQFDRLARYLDELQDKQTSDAKPKSDS
jgi:DNA-binding transcriptional ArsR family regulator